MQEISIFVILKATSTDRQTRRLHIFKNFCIYLASDNTLIILVCSDQMTSEARTHKSCAWAACGNTLRFLKLPLKQRVINSGECVTEYIARDRVLLLFFFSGEY